MRNHFRGLIAVLSITVVAILVLLVAVSETAGGIHEAVETGDSATVASLLDSHSDSLNARDSLGMTSLNIAAYKGHSSLVRELLRRGADVTIGDRDSSQPTHNAAVAGQVGALGLLINAGADINAQDRNGQTALLFAMLYSKPEAARWLIERGADVNLANREQSTPLQIAALSGSLEFAHLLILHGAKTEAADSYGRTPLLLVARERGNPEMAAFLLDRGANINAQDRFGDTPLSLAAWRGFRSLADLLVTRGASLPPTPDARKGMIAEAAQHGMDNLFRALVDSVHVISERSGSGGTLLHEAAKGGSAEMCDLLIARGLKVDDRDRYGRIPLHYAAERGRSQACSLLVARGANADAQSLAGYTPLSLAVEFEKDQTSALLRQIGATIEKPNFPRPQGPYFGQEAQGNELQPFALDIVASCRFKHGSITFSPDGLEAYWSSEYAFADSGYSVGGILTSRVENGYWTVPRLAEFSSVGINDDVPHFQPGGNRLFFLSRRLDDSAGEGRTARIWYVDRTPSGWSKPRCVQTGLDGHRLHWQFTVAANGNIYFSSGDPRGLGNGDIWVSRYVGGQWQPAEHLDAAINSPNMEMCPFIAPDESYLIVTTTDPDSPGGLYLKISYRRPDGTWRDPVELQVAGKRINGLCPMVSSDGKYLFLNSSPSGESDIYWVDGKIIGLGAL